MMDLKKIAAEAVLVGALAATAFGIGSGVASAAPVVPPTPAAPWLQDKPHWDGDGGHDGHRGGKWGKGPHHGGPGFWRPIDACVTATGPYGYVAGYACI